jgi:peptidoglycan hydrolase CwlO-like protein
MGEHDKIDIGAHSSALSEYGVRISNLEKSQEESQINSSRITELERRVDVMSERTHHYEEKIDNMDKSIQLLNEKQDTLKERMPSRDEWQTLKKSIDELKGKGAKTYDRIKGIALTAIITGVATYYLMKFLESINGGTP